MKKKSILVVLGLVVGILSACGSSNEVEVSDRDYEKSFQEANESLEEEESVAEFVSGTVGEKFVYEEGRPVKVPYEVEVQNNKELSLGVWAFVNGEVQPYWIEDEDGEKIDEEQERHVIHISKEEKNKRIYLVFYPVSGKAGEEVSLYVTNEYDPEYVSKNNQYGFEHQISGAMNEYITLKADGSNEHVEGTEYAQTPISEENIKAIEQFHPGKDVYEEIEDSIQLELKAKDPLKDGSALIKDQKAKLQFECLGGPEKTYKMVLLVDGRAEPINGKDYLLLHTKVREQINVDIEIDLKKEENYKTAQVVLMPMISKEKIEMLEATRPLLLRDESKESKQDPIEEEETTQASETTEKLKKLSDCENGEYYLKGIEGKDGYIGIYQTTEENGYKVKIFDQNLKLENTYELQKIMKQLEEEEVLDVTVTKDKKTLIVATGEDLYAFDLEDGTKRKLNTQKDLYEFDQIITLSDQKIGFAGSYEDGEGKLVTDLGVYDTEKEAFQTKRIEDYSVSQCIGNERYLAVVEEETSQSYQAQNKVWVYDSERDQVIDINADMSEGEQSCISQDGSAIACIRLKENGIYAVFIYNKKGEQEIDIPVRQQDSILEVKWNGRGQVCVRYQQEDQTEKEWKSAIE